MPKTDILSGIAECVAKLRNSPEPAAYIMLAPETANSLIGDYHTLKIGIEQECFALKTDRIICGLKVIRHRAIRPDCWLLLDHLGRPLNADLPQHRSEAGNK